MAMVGIALQRVKDELEQRGLNDQVKQICAETGHAWRDRILNPPKSVQLLLLQLLAGVALKPLRHVAQIAVSAPSICRARMRLPIQVLMGLVALVSGTDPACLEPDLWRGLWVYVADGMSFLVDDTPRLAAKYGKAGNHKGKNSYPVPKLLMLVDLASGMIRGVVGLPWARQEQTCLTRLFRFMKAGSLLLTDRGLVSYNFVAMLLGRGLHACMRLPQSFVVHGRDNRKPRSKRSKKAKGKKSEATHHRLRHLGKQDMLVRWDRPRWVPGWLSRLRWRRLPKSLTLRQIAFRICRPGYRPKWAWVITTLLDPQAYPASEIVTLASRRWQVEVYFRDMKQTLGMWKISARTPQGVRKEVLAFVLLYNLIRQIMVKAAVAQGVEPERISFKDAMVWLLWSLPGAAMPLLSVNPKRYRPTEARRLKRGRRRFPCLNKPRASFRMPRCVPRL